MVLPIPKTVEDRSLLEQEPFKTYFEVQKYQGEPLSDRKTNARPRLFADIERAMRAEPSGVSFPPSQGSFTELGPSSSTQPVRG